MNIIEYILTSNEEYKLEETVFNIHTVAMPQGSKGSKIINPAEDIRTKRPVTQINNDDKLCCPRAIVTALTHHMDAILGVKLDKHKIRNIRIGRNCRKI